MGPAKATFYNSFPIRPNLKMGTVPVVMVRALNVLSNTEEMIPISLGVRYAADQQLFFATQRIASERVLEWSIDGEIYSFKGAGERDQGNRYFVRIGMHSGHLHGQTLAPFSINPQPSLPTHLLLGGCEQEVLEWEFAQSQRLVNMIEQLGLSLGGLPQPVAIYRLQEMPIVNPAGELRIVTLEEYFMNPAYTTMEQRAAVLKYIIGNDPLPSDIQLAQKGQNSLDKNNLEAARAFVRLFQPAVYKFKGRTGPRIGAIFGIIANSAGMLRDLLMYKGLMDEKLTLNDTEDSKKKLPAPFGFGHLTSMPVDAQAGLQVGISSNDIKIIMDDLMNEFYLSVGLKIVLPEQTAEDLLPLQGRLNYLKAIGALNAEAAAKMRKIFVAELAKELGVIHGSGGHVGGNSDLGRGGYMRLHFIDKSQDPFVLKVEFSKIRGNSLDWEKNIPSTASLFSFEGLTLIKIQDGEQEGFAELGSGGGGSTRSDNVGVFGMRDFDTLCLMAQDPLIDSLISLFPDQLTNSTTISPYLKYFFLMLKQKLDIQALYINWQSLSSNFFPGTFMHFVALTGGGESNYYSLKDEFISAYCKWYDLALKTHAPDWFRTIRGQQQTNRLTLDFAFTRNCPGKESDLIRRFFENNYEDTFLA